MQVTTKMLGFSLRKKKTLKYEPFKALTAEIKEIVFNQKSY